MGGDVRRAAGTRAVSNLLPLPWRLFGDAAKQAAADLAAFDAGTSCLVVAFARQDAVFRRGALSLTRHPADVVWYFAPARLAPQPFPLAPPVRIRSVTSTEVPDVTPFPKAKFQLLTLEAAGAAWELAVPTLDVPLVRAALSAANAAA